jgi:solute carrier family 5 (sodium-dependent multivitamin transporter), member 6
LSGIDWAVMFATLAAFVAYGVWRGRGARDVEGYLLAGRSLRSSTVLLSVMATQASAVTFLATPGQGYADGLRFVQFYFGLPLAMVVLCFTAIPAYRRAGVVTAYEWLERRFDGKTRTLASALFLLQRGLSAGITIYAPALVLSVLLGWDVRLMCLLIGGISVIYTTSGGSKAVGHAHALQFSIILGTMALAFVLVVRALPAGIGVTDAAHAAGVLGRMRALNTTFDPNDRYNLWSGLLGGFFLQMSYFGADQSQVGRYLAAKSARESQVGLLWNGVLKIPMQFAILFLGVMVFAFHLFTPAPLFFNSVETHKVETSARAPEWRDLERDYRVALAERATAARTYVTARRAAGDAGAADARGALRAAQGKADSLRARAAGLVRDVDPQGQTNDTNYIFLRFVLSVLPIGVIGLVLAAIFAAAMNTSSAEMNSLASTTVVDVVRRLRPGVDGRHDVWLSRLATLGWMAFAVGFAEFASRLGSLIEAVNILGSLFYGTILGLFLVAFFSKRVGAGAVFLAALLSEAAVIAVWLTTDIGFLWFNVIGCALVVAISWMFARFPAGARAVS